MLRKSPFILICLLVCGMGLVERAHAQAKVRVETASPISSGEFQISINKSEILRVDRPIADVLVGSSEIADVVVMSDRSVYVLGKKLGTTTLTLYGANQRPLAIMDLAVTPDLPTLRRRFHDVMPGEAIEVRATSDGLVLSGAVSSPSRLDQALRLAESFAPGKVNNLVTLVGSQQVMLAVRFAEVQRTTAKQIGINTNALIGSGNDLLAISTGVIPSTPPFGFIEGLLTSGNVTIDAVLDALERKGVIRTLAEPNLISLSGETASFLAGGEFPIPVGRNRNNGDIETTIAFKEFGVKLAFTPTVVGDSMINLVVAPEVSAIDNNISVAVDGLLIPGLTVRRANTTVDLRHGESFAIAGLIQSNFTNAVQQMPFLGDIPILGSLLRSSSFQRDESELVIIVTPYLVRPASLSALSLPTDRFTPPSDVDLFLMGRIESNLPSAPQALSTTGAMPPGGGLAGNVGYIIR